ncbi:dynein axonemal intermediate chain 7 isoform X2 [Sphaerodactylus townsendi]|uniref:dynein axonemal intermediate chain 7 isoform X2 n=1 Tax=Sphaerodactylus townsendi TaxID=933632 RepID=UPI0020270115|nr:dynein axonemal intermediate chain 7 isoform X2 [Sphaerodactylus townsendi]
MSAGSGRKKKPSKAERLKMQREEEERRLFEERAARLRAEMEEAARLELDRIEKEKTEQLEAKEQERRGIEVTELSALEEKFLTALQWKADLRASAKWSHYMACDGSPDPTVPQEINTFMSLWQEDKKNSIQHVMEKGSRVLELIRKLQFAILDAPYEELTSEDVARYQDTIQKLQALLHQKYNDATEQMLKQASSYAESESGNMEVVIKDKNVTLCVWANLKKNSKFRNQTFRDEERNPINRFELPKPLAICDVAVRILHTHYDHLSPLESFPREPPKLPLPDYGLPLTVTAEVKEAVEEDKVAAKSMLDLQNPSMLIVKPPMSPISSKDMKDPMLDEVPPEVYEKKSMIIRSASRAQFCALYFPEISEMAPLEAYAVDLHQFLPVGGVYHFDALKLPPQAKHARGWTMVEVLDTGLETYPYAALCEESEDASQYFVGLTVRLLDDVIFFEEPLIARWDPKGNFWRTDAIGDVVYDMTDKEVSFKMSNFSTVALMQEAHLNMPYQSWELRPHGPDQAVLIVVTTFAEVQIQIQKNQCMLISVSTMEDADLLGNLRGIWMPPLALTIALKQAGMNIFPAEHSSKYVSLNRKTLDMELICYQQMALVASAFAFGWSKWNWHCGEDQIVFKAQEQLDQVADQDKWALYMFNGQRAQKLKITENSKTFSKNIAEGSEFHSTLFHLLKDTASEAAMESVQGAHYLFTDSVYQLLLATRVLTYS